MERSILFNDLFDMYDSRRKDGKRLRGEDLDDITSNVLLYNSYIGIESVNNDKEYKVPGKKGGYTRESMANLMAELLHKHNKQNVKEIDKLVKKEFAAKTGVVVYDSNDEEENKRIKKRQKENAAIFEINGTPYYVNFQPAFPSGYISYLIGFVRYINPDELKNYKLIYDELSEEGKKQKDEDKRNEQKLDKDTYWLDVLSDYKQVILTGAPGTGKTYKVREVTKELTKTKFTLRGKEINRSEFVQFHSSYDYSDFVEGLRPVNLGGNTFVRLDGSFKSFCRTVAEYNLERLSQSDNYKKFGNANELFKLFSLEDEYQDAKDIRSEIKDYIDDKEHQFFFVIDEINRADIGRVFGELMFGLEESYRGIENRFKTQYINLEAYIKDGEEYKKIKDIDGREDVFEKGFFVPENVHIVGTMNDIDRSVESFDFALRRRFQWIDVKAEVVMRPTLREMLKGKIDYGTGEEGSQKSPFDILVDRISNLNSVISDKNKGGRFGLSEAFHIGPAYFKTFGDPIENSSDPDSDKTVGYQQIWKWKLEPILKEYVRGRDSQDVKEFMRECAKAFETMGALSDEYKNQDEIDSESNDSDSVDDQDEDDE